MRARLAIAVAAVLLAACSSDTPSFDFDTAPPAATDPAGATTTAPTVPDITAAPDAYVVSVEPDELGEPISPLIIGISGELTTEEARDVGLRFSSWGGNPATRYNYMIGHAWNHGADFEFRNTNYGVTGDGARDSAADTAAFGGAFRLAVPTIGWVARDDSNDTCSFPDGNGGCLPAEGLNCEAEDAPVADPRRANVDSTPEQVADWVGGMVADGLSVDFVAMDNEPELWGYTHYDVHPECTTYEEILERHFQYAVAVKDVAPDTQVMGPATCCWLDYWNIAPGPADGSGEDFLPWYLRNVRQRDEQLGRRTLDVLDVHYYPQASGVYSEADDPETNALRLRSTRSLWDPGYEDESWIDTTIRLIPRLREAIEESYPRTKLAITEWNFGADTTMNGAVAIAEVLGVYGREGVYASAYWRNPPPRSPGYYAFKMHGNYDSAGSRFGGNVAFAESDAPAIVSVFAAVDEVTGVVRVMLINKDPEQPATIDLQVGGEPATGEMRRFTYGPEHLDQIVADTVVGSAPLMLGPYTITVLEIAR